MQTGIYRVSRPQQAPGTSIQSRILRRAADVLGGREELCAILGVGAEQLSRWIHDREVPPLHLFMRAVRVTVVSDDLRHGPEVAAERLGRRLTSTLS